MMFERNPFREFPDGTIRRVYPFHISLEGIEKKILFRDEEDYDVFVKILAVCSLRKAVVIVMYAVVSNHMHSVILAPHKDVTDDFANEVKRRYSLYFGKKYSERSTLKKVGALSIWIDSDWYLRHAIAYDIRNALDNSSLGISSYKWTGYRALFCNGTCTKDGKKVSSLSKRERESIMHTGDNLSGVLWILDSDGAIEPASFCDWRYAEAAFKNDQAFFMKVIGVVSTTEMTVKLVVNPSQGMNDNDFLHWAQYLATRWFNAELKSLPVEKKARMIQYAFRAVKTSAAQLARIFGIDRETISALLFPKRKA